MKFNINETVHVKLTPLGKKILKVEYDKFWKEAGYNPPYDFTLPAEDMEGWSQWQLWDLMNKFGEHCNLGSELPFETDIDIVIREKA